MALNWSGGATGALSGAGTGATLGGPWGAALGGALGGGLGLFTGGAENDSLKKFDTGTKEQQQLHNGILSQAMGMSNGGGYQNAQNYYNSLFAPGNQAYENFASPYMNQFQEQVLPQIAERFAGAGALSSSGFGQALGGAGAGLQSQLAQLFAQLQRQAAGAQTHQYNQLAQLGLNHEQFGYRQKEGNQGFGGSLAEGLSDPENMQGILNGIMSLFKKKQPGLE
jgi:hypothetical protein